MSPDEIARRIVLSKADLLEDANEALPSLLEAAIAAALTTEREKWRAETDRLATELRGMDALFTAERTAREKAEAERDRMRQYIAEVHNKVRHELSAEIEAATDKAFRALSGTQILSLIRKQEPTS